MTSLKDRIAALQQKTNTPVSTQNSPPKLAPSTTNGRITDRIANFEKKGGPAPVPRGSFGLGAPPPQNRSTSRELYGNRFTSSPMTLPENGLGSTTSIRSTSNPLRRERRISSFVDDTSRHLNTHHPRSPSYTDGFSSSDPMATPSSTSHSELTIADSPSGPGQGDHSALPDSSESYQQSNAIGLAGQQVAEVVPSIQIVDHPDTHECNQTLFPIKQGVEEMDNETSQQLEIMDNKRYDASNDCSCSRSNAVESASSVQVLPNEEVQLLSTPPITSSSDAFSPSPIGVEDRTEHTSDLPSFKPTMDKETDSAFEDVRQDSIPSPTPQNQQDALVPEILNEYQVVTPDVVVEVCTVDSDAPKHIASVTDERTLSQSDNDERSYSNTTFQEDSPIGTHEVPIPIELVAEPQASSQLPLCVELTSQNSPISAAEVNPDNLRSETQRSDLDPSSQTKSPSVLAEVAAPSIPNAPTEDQLLPHRSPTNHSPFLTNASAFLMDSLAPHLPVVPPLQRSKSMSSANETASGYAVEKELPILPEEGNSPSSDAAREGSISLGSPASETDSSGSGSPSALGRTPSLRRIGKVHSKRYLPGHFRGSSNASDDHSSNSIMSHSSAPSPAPSPPPITPPSDVDFNNSALLKCPERPSAGSPSKPNPIQVHRLSAIASSTLSSPRTPDIMAQFPPVPTSLPQRSPDKNLARSQSARVSSPPSRYPVPPTVSKKSKPTLPQWYDDDSDEEGVSGWANVVVTTRRYY